MDINQLEGFIVDLLQDSFYNHCECSPTSGLCKQHKKRLAELSNTPDKCPKCKGKGYTEEYNPDWKEDESEDCSLCNGTGKKPDTNPRIDAIIKVDEGLAEMKDRLDRANKLELTCGELLEDKEAKIPKELRERINSLI